jgi:hypothetical protein
VDPVVRESVGPVLRDLAGSGITAPVFDDNDWVGDDAYVSSMMWGSDGSAMGLSVRRADPLVDRVAHAADQVQEWAIEDQLWEAGRTNWPPCPHHPDRHPLQAVITGSDAVWRCPVDDAVMARVGALHDHLS